MRKPYLEQRRERRWVWWITSRITPEWSCISVDILYSIFNHCFEHATILQIWQEGIIHPIFKPSNTDIRDPLQYCGIIIMCASYKMDYDIVNTRLISWLEENSAIPDEQNGLCAFRSCIGHIFVLYVIQSRLLMKQDTLCCYIDIH